MAILVINKTIEVPNVISQDIDWVKLADGDYTADGTYREDLVGDNPIRRVWRIDVRRITKAQYDAIINYLTSIYWSRTLFWLDEFGGAAETDSRYGVFALVKDSRVEFGRGGAWHTSGRNLSLTIREE